jgi:DNA-binding response OmpR family regulator
VGERPKILIVDDAPDFCDALALLLEAEGYDCKVAKSGRHAIELLPEYPPDVVMIDWEMPIMNGAEFLRNRILYPELQGVPVIVISARDVRSTAQTLGAIFLMKPFSVERLLSVVENLLATETA